MERTFWDKKQANLLIFACWLVYTAAYIGRLNFGASMVAILPDLEVSKAEAGTVSAAFFLAYGIGQLTNGLLSRFYNGKKVIFGALLASAALNFLLPLAPGIPWMRVIWFANGLAQSFLWCVLIRILAQYLPDGLLPGAILVMSTTVAAGTFLAYGLSAVSAGFFTWRLAFYLPGGILLAAAAVWLLLLNKAENGNPAKQAASASALRHDDPVPQNIDLVPRQKGSALPWMLVFFCLAGMANGFVKDGIITWTPTLLSEQFQFSPANSIALALFIPLLSVLGAFLAKNLARRRPSHMALLGLLFLAAAAMSFAAGFALPVIALLAVLVAAACLMAAVNNVLTGMVPLYFRKYADSGLLAGVINTFCYVGSMASAAWLGRIAQRFGWTVFFLWLMAVSLGAAAVSFIGRLWEKKKNTSV